eukprot:PhF_6_TR38574/c2_g3_i1/m.57275
MHATGLPRVHVWRKVATTQFPRTAPRTLTASGTLDSTSAVLPNVFTRRTTRVIRPLATLPVQIVFGIRHAHHRNAVKMPAFLSRIRETVKRIKCLAQGMLFRNANGTWTATLMIAWD